MIELKNINKNYKSKKGLSTDALKGINLKLGESGLTFILGKSGSGKSTLLNILGGLDSATSGEIIVNGKSTDKFKESDWDSYRNTYMGFIFQEYNLLDNYSVEDNIKLAMNLQHKKCSSKDVMEVLKLVELDDVLKRKPNELSGGQKQRIAIARALIKDPEIILADEPTGNLDSETSKKIFEILKKISQNKLVVIVSHDEESANKYADRIVRISDGLVVSDTFEGEVTNTKEFKLISAKLPFLYSFKMGLGNLFHKKIKLFFSAFLIILSLISFGTMMSTLSVDTDKEYYDLFEKNESTEVNIIKYKNVINYENIFVDYLRSNFDSSSNGTEYPLEHEKIDKDFIDKVSNNTKLNWYGNYNLLNNGEVVSWVYERELSYTSPYYYYLGDNYISIRTTDDERLKDMKIIGNIPENENEIIISSYIADQIIYNGISGKRELNSTSIEIYKPGNYDDIINDNIYINLGDMLYIKVVGIIDYRDELKKYSDFKEMSLSVLNDLYITDQSKYNSLMSLESDFSNDCEQLYRVYVTQSFIDKMYNKENNVSLSSTKVHYNDRYYDVFEFGYLNDEVIIYTNEGTKNISSLNENEIVLNTYLLNLITGNDYLTKLENAFMLDENFLQEEFLKQYLAENNIIGQTIKGSIKNKTIYYDADNFGEYKIVGIINDDGYFGVTYYNKNLVSDLISECIELDSAYRTIDNLDDLKTVLKYYPIDKSNVLSSSEYSDIITDAIMISSLVKIVGKFGTVVFLVLSILILISFINTSIAFRKKEIGILRAIGCRKIDVISMFIYECLSLMLFCLVVSYLIVPSITNMINGYCISLFYLSKDAKMMNFGLTQIMSISGIMIAIVIVSSILPLIRLTKMKPIDTILDK